MPDHLHLLVQGVEDEANLKALVKDYKQRTGYAFKKETGKVLWQKSYIDHILRKEESIEEVAAYILENPVRRKLIDDYRKWPFSGSFVEGVFERMET